MQVAAGPVAVGARRGIRQCRASAIQHGGGGDPVEGVIGIAGRVARPSDALAAGPAARSGSTRPRPAQPIQLVVAEGLRLAAARCGANGGEGGGDARHVADRVIRARC